MTTSTIVAVVLIFLVVAVVLLCLVFGYLAEERTQRMTLFGAAGALTLCTALGVGWFLMSTPPARETATVEDANPPAKKQEKKAVSDPESGVVLVVDESTVRGGTEKETLDLENTADFGTTREARREARAIGRSLRNIEQDLESHLQPLLAQMQTVDSRFRAREINNYESLSQKSRLKVECARWTMRAMDAKLRILQKTKYLTNADIAKDVARVEKRRERAQRQQDEYEAALRELAQNANVFRDL